MKRRLIGLLLIAGFCAVAGPATLAQENQGAPDAETHAPGIARFEIVQSPIVRKETFKIDKWSGRVWQMVKSTKGYTAWEPMPVVGLPKATRMSAHYQIFLSGMMARDAFLLNVDTGRSWRLTCLVDAKAQDEGCEWDPMRDLSQ